MGIVILVLKLCTNLLYKSGEEIVPSSPLYTFSCRFSLAELGICATA